MDHSEDEQSPTKSEQTKQATNVEPSSQSSPRTAEQSQASGSTDKGPDQKMTEQTRSPRKQNRSRTRGPVQSFGLFNPKSKTGSGQRTGQMSPSKSPIHSLFGEPSQASSWDNPISNKRSARQTARQTQSPKKQMHPRIHKGHVPVCSNPTPHVCPDYQMAERTLSPQKQMNPSTGEQGYTSAYANPTPYVGSGYPMPGQYPSPQMHPRTGEQDHTFAYANPTPYRGSGYPMMEQNQSPQKQMNLGTGEQARSFVRANPTLNLLPYHMTGQRMPAIAQIHSMAGNPYQASGWDNAASNMGSGYRMAEPTQSPQKQMHPGTNEHSHSFAGANPTQNILPPQMMGQHMAAMGQIPPRAGDPYQVSGWDNAASNRGSGYQMEKQTLSPEKQMHPRIGEQSYASACAIPPANRGYAHQLVVNLPQTSQYASRSGEPDQASGWHSRPSYSGTDQERGESHSKTKLFVGHLTKNVSDEDIRSLFCCMGTVDECDKVTSEYAFVHMSTPEEANLAIKYLNNTMLLDAHIIVEHAKTPFYPKPKNAGKSKDPKYAGSEAIFIEDDEDEQIAICMQASQNQSQMQSLQEQNVVPEMPMSFEQFSVATNQWSQPRSVLFRNNPQLYSESAGDASSVSPNSSADDPSDPSVSASQHKTDESNAGVNPEPQLLQNPFFDYNLNVPSWENW